MYCIYWIKLPHHKDVYSQGYVGITENFDRRMNQYKRSPNTKSKSSYHITNAIRKYGWDSMEKIVLHDGLTKEEALSLEKKYRPNQLIGWNTFPGGGVVGNHSQEVKNKISHKMLGNKNSNGFNSNIVTCPYCKKSGQQAAMSRWHFDNCKYKYDMRQ